ncbi:Hypothetical protein R9X50_00572900 [Acrodontium crateriforme]|uniref:CID domain-containing protein n=1 Tax=Acrodontium crateriforme TaxID=150365 RepID=A0AAQ3MA95_9PEZI|nr:Hypothetical protein R9X50_00572900 [Acrodontium crateriforme]
MADGEEVKEFPDVKDKLAAPKKLSQFERDRQAAEAKRLRAKAEDEAALKAFQDSFDLDNEDKDDDDMVSRIAQRRETPAGPRGAGMGFIGNYGPASSGPRSGPGSLGPGPGPPPMSLKRKRALDEMREAQEARQEREIARSGPYKHQEDTYPDEDLRDEAPKPTIAVSSLPPGTSESDIRALLEDYLQIHSVDFLPPAGPGGPLAKRSMSAIVTLVSETPTPQIDNAVSALKERYLSCGFYLSINRHLSSSALHPSMTINTTTSSTEVFGAEMPREPQSRNSMRNAPPPMEHRGFAPPNSYDFTSLPGYGMSMLTNPCVAVQVPLDIQTLRAINTVADRLLSEPDPMRALQIEAMLMAQPKVQKDEHFAFLYDSRSPGGVYYRYLLWRADDNESIMKERKQISRVPERIYEDVPVDWSISRAKLPFPDLTDLSQVVADLDYASSDEESDDEGVERQFNNGRNGDQTFDGPEKCHLTPVQYARLIHLLCRLPKTHARLRKGDIARITNFAINHAGKGAEEIVDVLLLNIARPFSLTQAAQCEHNGSSEEDDNEPDAAPPSIDALAATNDAKRDEDPSGAKLIGLYVISDILSASSTAGARNAWKYRQLLETGFKAHGTFERLGRLEKELSWGRMKAEQWKRKIDVVFSIWEGWSVFASGVQDEFKKAFFTPPLTADERKAEEQRAEEETKKTQAEKLIGKFKRVGSEKSLDVSISSVVQSSSEADKVAEDENIDGEPMDDDIDGEPMDDIDGEAMSDVEEGTSNNNEDHNDAIPAMDGASDQQHANDFLPTTTSTIAKTPQSSTPKNSSKPRTGRRMRAEDMFADSDENE